MLIQQIIDNVQTLFKQSLVLPIIASAFLSVITADFARQIDKIEFFVIIHDNGFTELLDIGLHYILAFLFACTILLLIYFLVSTFKIIFFLFF